MKDLWLVARELGGWAEAGGVKDVVRDQARALGAVGWKAHVVLPLYGFLRARVQDAGVSVWQGLSRHPLLPVGLEVWRVEDGEVSLHFVSSPGFIQKDSLYTYSAAEERMNPGFQRGEGYRDGLAMNLEFQWAVASYWESLGRGPEWVLGHDGHTGFLPAICRTHPGFHDFFSSTHFAVLIHNAGQGYRQEMEANAYHEDLLGVPQPEARACIIDRHFDPLASASRHGRLATVSENYADELLTGRNDHWSGPFGKWLRQSGTPLQGITNGISTDDKDPRDPEAAGLPVGFDPLRGEWEGKKICRRLLRERLLLNPSETFGRLVYWDGPLYVMQGRLTSQKGVEALLELVPRALHEAPKAAILIMAQGERRYEERMIRLARDRVETGRFLYVDKFEESLARLLLAAADFFLMPSEYEPCGLTDLKAQLMGALPIVHRVGGLVKVRDEETGFSYVKNRAGGLWGAFVRSYVAWGTQPERLALLRRQAFSTVLEEYQWPRILEEKYLPWLTDAARFPILTLPSPT